MARLVDRHDAGAQPAPPALLDKVGQRRGGLDESGAASMGGGERELTTRRGENFFPLPFIGGNRQNRASCSMPKAERDFFMRAVNFITWPGGHDMISPG